MRDTSGMTLLEVMIALSIFTVVSGTLYVVALGVQNAGNVQESKIILQDELRRALQMVTSELRVARNLSIVADELPGSSITYQTVNDLDGNGWVVDNSGLLEMSPPKRIGLDEEDVNEDGYTTTQLILFTEGDDAPVLLANHLAAEEGVLFERVGEAAIRVTLRAEKSAHVSGAESMFSGVLTEIVSPRN